MKAWMHAHKLVAVFAGVGLVLLAWWAWHRTKVARSYGVPLKEAFFDPLRSVPQLWSDRRSLEMTRPS
jgi:hypothetical protein